MSQPITLNTTQLQTLTTNIVDALEHDAKKMALRAGVVFQRGAMMGFHLVFTLAFYMLLFLALRYLSLRVRSCVRPRRTSTALVVQEKHNDDV